MKNWIIIPFSLYIQLLRIHVLFVIGLQTDRGVSLSDYRHNGTHFSLQRYHGNVCGCLWQGRGSWFLAKDWTK